MAQNPHASHPLALLRANRERPCSFKKLATRHHAGHSVLSAIEGLKLITPALEGFILPLTLAILIGLFVMQRRGTASIGHPFGPIMVGWFLVIGVLGVINIWAAPEILKAASPDAAARFVFANPLIASP
jgi:KUP system potassium uptake protein